MRLHRKKWLFFFFILLMVCSQTALSQNQKTRQISVAEPNVPEPEIEIPAPSLQTSIVVDRPDKIFRTEGKKKAPETALPTIERIKFDFRAVADKKPDFRSAARRELEKAPYKKPFLPLSALKKKTDEDAAPGIPATGFNWRGALSQSFLFLGIQHGFAIISQEKTRRSLKGKFWSEYVDSVKSLKGWDDGGRFFTNYIAHPLQGSFTGFIYVQNSPQAKRAQFGASRDYWSSRMKAMLWTAVWSTQFEIGPISQASIGNVGLSGKQTWEDIVVTPTLGTAMLIAEDAIDRYIIRSIERRWDNFYVKIFSRMLLNPTRIFANMLRFKPPWYRDRPTAR
jgi:hypothetical protein